MFFVKTLNKIIKMCAAYFFNNETKNESVYVKNTGTYTLEIETVASKVLQMKKWDVKDKIVIMLMDSNKMSRYIYKDNRFELCFNEDSKYDAIEIETHDDDMSNDDELYDEDEYDEYDEMDDYDERDYDERDYDNGYEDEFYECCDIY